MLWFRIESILTLPLLYAIISTIVEFRFGRLRSWAVIGLAICATIGMDFWIYNHTGELYSYAWITTCIPSFFSLLYLVKYRDGSFLFAYLTECVLASIATSLSYIFAELLPWQYPLIPILFHVAILAVALMACRKVFRKKVFEAERAQGKLWLLYCIMPVLSLIIWAMYTSSSTHMFDIENKIYVPYAGYIYPQSIPVLIVILAVVSYVLLLILVIVKSTHKAEMEGLEKAALDFQSMALKRRLSVLEEKDESLRILRHDMRHHLSMLSGLISSGEYPRANEYLRQLDDNLAQVKQESYCPNPIINAILSFYSMKAQKESIRFSVQVEISGELKVEDLDIGAVISNALENALNACMMQPAESERFIIFQFIRHNKQFVLDISNSFIGTVEFDINDRPISKIEDHGLGSQSISAFARKYKATMDYTSQNGIFSIRVMFTENCP